MTRRAALTDALLITLATPATWPPALATFLLRGGLLLVVFPIVVLPSPVGLGNLLAPTLMSAVFGGASVEVALIFGTIALGLVAWIAIGGLLAASLEAEAVRIVAAHEAEPAASRRFGETGRILAARLLAHVPTGVAVVWGTARLVGVAYRELTSPLDVATSIVLRVLRGAPEVIVAIVLLWVIGEVIGAMATRRIVFDGAGVVRALRDATVTAVRRPLTVSVLFLLPTLVLMLVLAPSALAAAAAWGASRVALRSSGDPLSASITVASFVALWIAGLLLVGVTSAWRSAVWSVAHGDPVDRLSDIRQARSG